MGRDLELIEAIGERIAEIQTMFGELRDVIQNKNNKQQASDEKSVALDNPCSDVKSMNYKDRQAAVLSGINIFSVLDKK